jgi:hypothetical protein
MITSGSTIVYSAETALCMSKLTNISDTNSTCTELPKISAKGIDDSVTLWFSDSARINQIFLENIVGNDGDDDSNNKGILYGTTIYASSLCKKDYTVDAKKKTDYNYKCLGNNAWQRIGGNKVCLSDTGENDSGLEDEDPNNLKQCIVASMCACTEDINSLNEAVNALTNRVTPIANGGTGNTTGNAATATKLATARTITLSGAVTGSGSFDGSGNLTISTAQAGSGNMVVNVTVKENTWTNLLNASTLLPRAAGYSTIIYLVVMNGEWSGAKSVFMVVFYWSLYAGVGPNGVHIISLAGNTAELKFENNYLMAKGSNGSDYNVNFKVFRLGSSF